MRSEARENLYTTLRGRCPQCGEAIGRHAYCNDCGQPRKCGDEAGWLADRAQPEVLRCPVCVDGH